MTYRAPASDNNHGARRDQRWRHIASVHVAICNWRRKLRRCI